MLNLRRHEGRKPPGHNLGPQRRVNNVKCLQVLLVPAGRVHVSLKCACVCLLLSVFMYISLSVSIYHLLVLEHVINMSDPREGRVVLCGSNGVEVYDNIVPLHQRVQQGDEVQKGLGERVSISEEERKAGREGE